MKILETERDPASEILAALTSEARGPDPEIEHTVREIIEDVRKRGDAALLELGRKFDSPELNSIRVEPCDFDAAYDAVPPDLLAAIRTAKSNIEEFHRKQLCNSWLDTREGFTYGQLVRPIERVGFYAPGGLAPYPSTVLMTAVPGTVADVKTLVMCCPAQRDGKISPAMLVAAKECSVTDVFKIGGAQAVAAMAFGTDTVPRVDKIVGPGNAYVAEAKRQLFGYVGIDQLAGPSEILVIADDSASPIYVAADLLSQAEHAGDSRCALITTSRRVADETLKEIRRQSERATRRRLIEESLGRHGMIVIVRNIDEAAELANAFAPEHLELAVADPWAILGQIKNAGTVMLGHHTPVPLCDYAAGPNHTLPTNGTARFSSALSVDDFVKKSGLLAYSATALRAIAPTVLELAAAEGFDAHTNAIRVRTT